MLSAIVEKEWCEVYRKGRGKVEDWSWRVDYIDRGFWQDAHYINNEADARMCAALFEAGAGIHSEYGGVCLRKAFA